MNKVDFFGHKVSKLIVGDNPFNGHSYITDKTPGSEMRDWYTSSRILDTLFAIEDSGINTMLPLSDPFIVRLLREYERAGGKMQWIFQPYMALVEAVDMRNMTSLQNTIGVYHQGTTTDHRFETGQTQEIIDRIARYKTMGIPVGVGTHRPDVIETSEREGWGADFYMACMYNARRNREGVESGFITGKSKQGLQFRLDDRQIMLDTLKKVEKPIIAFKIFAGGQMFLNRTPEEIRANIKDAYNTIFTSLKPNDIAAFGVFQRDKNELAEDVEIYNEWYRETHQEENA